MVSAILVFCLLSLLSTKSQSSSPCSHCTDQFLKLANSRNLTHCKNLNNLGAQLAWTVMGTQRNSSQIEVMFTAPLVAEPGWIAWGVNPGDHAQMVGTRALIGVVHPNRTSAIDKYNITEDTRMGCELRPSEIEPEVRDPRMGIEKGMIVMSARWVIPASLGYNLSRLNHVWQVGYEVAEGRWPGMHPTALQNGDCTETLDLKTGKSQDNGYRRHHIRVVHGVLNIVGWGTLLPMGAIISRYFKTFPVPCKPWFVFHVTCQLAGYSLGTIGWIIGIWLGQTSKHYSFPTHHLLAIFIFTFTTLQVMALQFRPKSTDDYRRHWNAYHHFLGYALFAVIFSNIFKGISILKPDHSWDWAYIGILISLGSIVLVLELLTWVRFIRDRTGASKLSSPVAPHTKTQRDNQVKDNDGVGPSTGHRSGAVMPMGT